MPNSEAERDHKRRQRHRQQERRRQALEELLAHIPTEFDSVVDLYQPIPALDTNPHENGNDFWKVVPAMCNPLGTVLDFHQIMSLDRRKVARDERFQRKLQSKLESRKERGEISKQEQEELWNQHGKVDSHLLSASRGQRKAWQVENFVVLLQHYLQVMSSNVANASGDGDDNNDGGGITVVDFGSGTGNLCLALAAYFPQIQFVLVDKNSYSLQLVQERADSANITNIQVQQFHFSSTNLQDYEAPSPNQTRNSRSKAGKSFDLGIGLHCCGSFTDMVMELCRIQGADCIVCPCCNGGLMTSFQYPRSSLLQQCMTEEEYRSQLSKSADDLHHYSAKCWIEYDRALWAQEHGMQVELWKLTPTESTPKHHVLYVKH